MPNESYRKALKACAEMNAEPELLMTHAVRRMSVPFDDAEMQRLKEAGYEKTDGDHSAFKGDSVVTKVELYVGLTVFVETGPGGKLRMHPDLSGPAMPAHVREFVEELRTGAGGEKWGRTGKDGLMYRGHNLFDAYVGKEFNDAVIELIINDKELREPCKCDDRPDGCLSMADRMKASGCDVSELRDAIEKCRAKNTIDPTQISCQEVYLGYYPRQDMFISAWDVFGSPSTGSVMIAFRVNGKGAIRHADDESYCWPDQIYDASNRKFYEKSPLTSKGGGKSLFELMHGNPDPKWELIDIRLD